MKEYVKIKEIGRVVTGKTPSTSDEDNFNGEYPFITPSDIPTFDEKCILETERTISSKGYKSLKNILLPSNTICFVCIGSTIGKMCFTHKQSFTNQQINSLIVNNNYDAQYVFYLLRYIKGYFQQIGAGTGSGKGIVNKRTFEKTRVKVEKDKATQVYIASILSAYDELIENNNKRIKTLEQMAENFYKEWFVRFRFPKSKNMTKKASSLGKIPNNFDVVKINTLIDYYIGGGWGADEPDNQFCEEAYVVRGTDFPHVKTGKLDTCPLRYHKTSNYEARELKANDIVIEVSGGTQEQPVGRSVLITQKQLDRMGNRLICASFCKQIRCKTDKIPPRYLYHWLQYMYETRMVNKYQLQSTGIINFQFEYFMRKCDVLLPPYELMEKFSNIVEMYYSEIDNIAQQNANLIKQRDLLLPRLMSGKLEVSEHRAIVLECKKPITYDEFVSEMGMAARGKSISEQDLKAMYEAYISDDATE